MSGQRIEKFEDLIAWQKARELTKGSCAELRSQLYVALDVEYIDVVTFQNLDNLARETSRLVGGLRAAVYRQKSKIE